MGKASSKNRDDGEGSDSSSSSGEAAGASTVAPTTAGGNYRISLSHSKPSVCCLCEAKSTDPTPLAEPDPALGGVIPWGKYRKIRLEDEVVKVPEGRIDLICLNTFRALGCWSFQKSFVFCFCSPA